MAEPKGRRAPDGGPKQPDADRDARIKEQRARFKAGTTVPEEFITIESGDKGLFAFVDGPEDVNRRIRLAISRPRSKELSGQDLAGKNMAVVIRKMNGDWNDPDRPPMFFVDLVADIEAQQKEKAEKGPKPGEKEYAIGDEISGVEIKHRAGKGKHKGKRDVYAEVQNPEGGSVVRVLLGVHDVIDGEFRDAIDSGAATIRIKGRYPKDTNKRLQRYYGDIVLPSAATPKKKSADPATAKKGPDPDTSKSADPVTVREPKKKRPPAVEITDAERLPVGAEIDDVYIQYNYDKDLAVAANSGSRDPFDTSRHYAYVNVTDSSGNTAMHPVTIRAPKGFPKRSMDGMKIRIIKVRKVEVPIMRAVSSGEVERYVETGKSETYYEYMAQPVDYDFTGVDTTHDRPEVKDKITGIGAFMQRSRNGKMLPFATLPDGSPVRLLGDEISEGSVDVAAVLRNDPAATFDIEFVSVSGHPLQNNVDYRAIVTKVHDSSGMKESERTLDILRPGETLPAVALRQVGTITDEVVRYTGTTPAGVEVVLVMHPSLAPREGGALAPQFTSDMRITDVDRLRGEVHVEMEHQREVCNTARALHLVTLQFENFLQSLSLVEENETTGEVTPHVPDEILDVITAQLRTLFDALAGFHDIHADTTALDAAIAAFDAAVVAQLEALEQQMRSIVEAQESIAQEFAQLEENMLPFKTRMMQLTVELEVERDKPDADPNKIRQLEMDLLAADSAPQYMAFKERYEALQQQVIHPDAAEMRRMPASLERSDIHSSQATLIAVVEEFFASQQQDYTDAIEALYAILDASIDTARAEAVGGESLYVLHTSLTVAARQRRKQIEGDRDRIEQAILRAERSAPSADDSEEARNQHAAYISRLEADSDAYLDQLAALERIRFMQEDAVFIVRPQTAADKTALARLRPGATARIEQVSEDAVTIRDADGITAEIPRDHFVHLVIMGALPVEHISEAEEHLVQEIGRDRSPQEIVAFFNAVEVNIPFAIARDDVLANDRLYRELTRRTEQRFVQDVFGITPEEAVLIQLRFGAQDISPAAREFLRFDVQALDGIPRSVDITGIPARDTSAVAQVQELVRLVRQELDAQHAETLRQKAEAEQAAAAAALLAQEGNEWMKELSAKTITDLEGFWNADTVVPVLQPGVQLRKSYSGNQEYWDELFDAELDPDQDLFNIVEHNGDMYLVQEGHTRALKLDMETLVRLQLDEFLIALDVPMQYGVTTDAGERSNADAKTALEQLATREAFDTPPLAPGDVLFMRQDTDAPILRDVEGNPVDVFEVPMEVRDVVNGEVHLWVIGMQGGPDHRTGIVAEEARYKNRRMSTEVALPVDDFVALYKRILPPAINRVGAEGAQAELEWYTDRLEADAIAVERIQADYDAGTIDAAEHRRQIRLARQGIDGVSLLKALGVYEFAGSGHAGRIIFEESITLGSGKDQETIAAGSVAFIEGVDNDRQQIYVSAASAVGGAGTYIPFAALFNDRGEPRINKATIAESRSSIPLFEGADSPGADSADSDSSGVGIMLESDITEERRRAVNARIERKERMRRVGEELRAADVNELAMEVVDSPVDIADYMLPRWSSAYEALLESVELLNRTRKALEDARDQHMESGKPPFWNLKAVYNYNKRKDEIESALMWFPDARDISFALPGVIADSGFTVDEVMRFAEATNVRDIPDHIRSAAGVDQLQMKSVAGVYNGYYEKMVAARLVDPAIVNGAPASSGATRASAPEAVVSYQDTAPGAPPRIEQPAPRTASAADVLQPPIRSAFDLLSPDERHDQWQLRRQRYRDSRRLLDMVNDFVIAKVANAPKPGMVSRFFGRGSTPTYTPYARQELSTSEYDPRIRDTEQIRDPDFPLDELMEDIRGMGDYTEVTIDDASRLVAQLTEDDRGELNRDLRAATPPFTVAMLRQLDRFTRTR